MGSRRAVSSARGTSGNSGRGSCDGRRPSAPRLSRGGARWPTPRASVPAPVPRSRPWAGAPPRARGETWNDSGAHSHLARDARVRHEAAEEPERECRNDEELAATLRPQPTVEATQATTSRTSDASVAASTANCISEDMGAHSTAFHDDHLTLAASRCRPVSGSRVRAVDVVSRATRFKRAHSLDGPENLLASRREGPMAKLSINGRVRDVQVEADTPLLWVIREQVGLTGTKYGCGVAQCGACSVQIMAAAALLSKKPKPTDRDIDDAMTNICRCGTYQRIRAAVHMAAGQKQA